ncbi:hypothetical protein [uncultured Parolsenella sp.]|uniref:coiled-coil domain-containing protein n=1 Tax=uncultured Parolsenella sp. TaxID=2083008 RepID=UPI002598855B|nr:hypothetical protein [uncultured Parolsenella sp.]
MRLRSAHAKARATIVAGLATALLCSSALAPVSAYAATADELQNRVDAATQAYGDASAKVSELQAKIDESQAKIDEVNAELPEQRERAEQSLSSLYKMQQGTPGLVSLLLSSDSFADFFTTYQYLNAVQRSNTDALAELNRMEGELSAAQQTLQAAKDEASAQQQQAQTSMTEAQTALDELNAQIAAQAAAEAAAQAQTEAQTQAQSQAASSPAASAPAASTPSNPSATDGSEVKSDGEWMIGMASAYSVDSNTGGNATASGDELTDDSMSVAVPLSQRYLLGRSVQIRYGGKTITAVVNDVGGFAAYGRVLDLAGGCWKAFGCSSASDWGVRAVQYRFL